MHVSFKPTSSIQVPGETIDLAGETGGGRHHRPSRSVRRPARHADRRSDAGDRADGSLPAPSRARTRTSRLQRRTSYEASHERQRDHFRVAVVGATGPRRRDDDPGARGARLPGLGAVSAREQPLARQDRRASTGKDYPVDDLATFDFSKADIGLFSAGGEVSREYAPKAAAAGCIVIDNTSRVPLPGRHPARRAGGESARHRAVQERAASSRTPTARPSRCSWRSSRSTTPWASSASTSRRISPSPAPGAKRWRSWPRRAPRCCRARARSSRRSSPSRSPSTACPRSTCFQDNGYTKEEMKMVWETRKIMEDPTIRVNPTAVRVPVFFGHSEAVHIETRRKITRRRSARAAGKSAGRQGSGRAQAGRVPNRGYRGSEPRHSLCRANT